MNTTLSNTIVTVFFVVCSFTLAWSGYSWITAGYGLHPLLAWPFAMLAYAMPIWHMSNRAKYHEAKVNNVIGFCEYARVKIDKLPENQQAPIYGFSLVVQKIANGEIKRSN